MNYIKKLEQENKLLTAKVRGYDEGLREIKAYLCSSKFHKEPHVNIKDIILRIDELDHYMDPDDSLLTPNAIFKW